MCSWQSDQEADGAAKLPIPAEERCLVDLHAEIFHGFTAAHGVKPTFRLPFRAEALSYSHVPEWELPNFP